MRRTAERCAGSAVRILPPCPACAHRAARSRSPTARDGARAGDRRTRTTAMVSAITTAIADQKHQRRVGRLALRQRHQQPPGSSVERKRRANPSCSDHVLEQRRSPASATARAARSQRRATASPIRSTMPASWAVLQRGFARLTEKDHAEELDHHVAGERRSEREQRRAERQQHVDERLAAPRARTGTTAAAATRTRSR